jgi:hypothetical protein
LPKYLVFKEQLEEVVWMGHSAKRLIDISGIWDNNKSNDDEQFWQLTFNENTYVLSQVFAVPVVFIQVVHRTGTCAFCFCKVGGSRSGSTR